LPAKAGTPYVVFEPLGKVAGGRKSEEEDRSKGKRADND